jgi:hypothetical protein
LGLGSDAANKPTPQEGVARLRKELRFYEFGNSLSGYIDPILMPIEIFGKVYNLCICTKTGYYSILTAACSKYWLNAI